MDKADIITDTASGSIASFSDGADDLPLKSLVVDINPVQDLHGQDAPYPAGGGKNIAKFADQILDNDRTQNGITFHALSENQVRISGTATGNAYLVNAQTYEQLVSEKHFYKAGTYTLSSNLPHNTNCYVYMTGFETDGTAISGNIVVGVYAGRSASFTRETDFYANIQINVVSGTDFTTPVDVWVQLESGSTATSYAPYENICPISGWTEVGVEQRGVNVWDEEWELGTFTANHEWGTGSYLGAKNPVRVVPNVTYYNFCPSGVLFVFYNSNGEYIEEKGVASNSTFTAPSGATTMRFRTFQAYGTTYNHDISINYPSTDHDYHPYTGRSITIDLGQTVYGGHLDVLSGVLTVDRAMVDLGTLGFVFSLSANRVSVSISDVRQKTSWNSHIGLCSCYLEGNISNNSGDAVGFGFYNTTLFVRDPRFTSGITTAQIQSLLSGQTLVYELATPIEIQLSVNQINSLYGQNNLWADSGDTMTEYHTNMKLYISKKITEAIASLT